jgi:hypothetical protein
MMRASEPMSIQSLVCWWLREHHAIMHVSLMLSRGFLSSSAVHLQRMGDEGRLGWKWSLECK